MKNLHQSMIVAVDDMKINLELIKDVLGEEYEVLTTDNGQDALILIENKRPDLILLDIKMSDMDGYEVCRRLKNNPYTCNIPIIFLSGMSQLDDKEQGFELGAVDYLTKPFEIAELRARVKIHLNLKIYQERLENQNVVLEEQVQIRTKELEKAIQDLRDSSFEMIWRLTRIAEFRDDDTGSHILRMSYYSAIIARSLGLDQNKIEYLMNAAPLHDIGKIAIPDKILLKPGRLTAEECEVMKTHTTIGAKILENLRSKMIDMGREIALTHHEKWDGSGYPQGLKGEQIPLYGRIVAVADVFDALMSKRPYKEAYSLEESLQIIREDSGKHFDPEVVKAFFSSLDEIRAMETGSLFSDLNCQKILNLSVLQGRLFDQSHQHLSNP